MDWLSVYMEECFSSSSPFSNPVSGKPPPTMANQGAGNPKLLPVSSSNGGQRKRSLTSILGEDYDHQYIIPLFIEPPLLPMDQKHWMAESELILPKKEKDQELCQQQEQEYKKVSLILLKKEKGEELCQQQEQEYKEVSLIHPKKEKDQELYQQQEQEYKEVKCEEDALMQFRQQELPLKRCSNCLSCQTSLWRHGLGLSGHKMLCNACSLKVKPGNGFTTISRKQCGQGTNKKQEQGERQDKKKMIKKEDASERELPVRACTHCMSSKTPQWRAGPMGPKTLCNACGVRYKSGRLFPEYRPANSPTFVSHIHSNSHKKVLQLRKADGRK